MFDNQTKWTETECFYVIASKGFHRAWIAGPYRTQSQADAVLPRAIRWAVRQSGDCDAQHYTYRVASHYNGEVRSILGEIEP
jgi:hypothetical protein